MAESGMPFTLGRRMVLAGLLCAPVPALAQPGRTYRVAVLEWEPQAGADGLAAFRQSLHSLGFVEGANLHVDPTFSK